MVQQSETETRPRVFLVEPPKAGIDVDGAREFGDLVFLFGQRSTGGVADRQRARPRPSTTDLQAFSSRVVDELQERGYDPQRVLFLTTGGQLQLMMAVAALCACYPRFKLVVFNAVHSEYAVKLFDFGALKGDATRWRDTDTTSRTRA